MPELPEVETVRRGLAPALEGQRLAEVRAYVPKLRFPLPADFEARLPGLRVTRLWRRAKFLVMSTEGGPDVIIHLGMSGHMSVLGHNRAAAWHPEKHDHVMFLTESGTRVVFNDARRFGLVAFAPRGRAEDHDLLKHLGPEPLAEAFDGVMLGARLKSRGAPVKTALLDQKLVAGIGNIYAAEALNRSRIHPGRKASKISPGRLDGLVRAIREVLAEAIEAGGSSLRDHAQVSGELGYFQHHFRVYDREGQPCRNDGCRGVIRRIVQAGRSTFYCPACQH